MENRRITAGKLVYKKRPFLQIQQGQFSQYTHRDYKLNNFRISIEKPISSCWTHPQHLHLLQSSPCRPTTATTVAANLLLCFTSQISSSLLAKTSSPPQPPHHIFLTPKH